MLDCLFKMMEMPKVLAVDNELCIGCERCALACAYRHFKSSNPRRGAIYVIKLEPGADTPVHCVQCGTCIDVCPPLALRRDRKTGVVRVDLGRCDGCGLCVSACPYGVIHVDPFTKKAVKCDYCGFCVRYCPQSALKLIEAEEAALWKRKGFAKSITAAPELARKLWYKPPFR